MNPIRRKHKNDRNPTINDGLYEVHSVRHTCRMHTPKKNVQRGKLCRADGGEGGGRDVERLLETLYIGRSAGVRITQ